MFSGFRKHYVNTVTNNVSVLPSPHSSHSSHTNNNNNTNNHDTHTIVTNVSHTITNTKKESELTHFLTSVTNIHTLSVLPSSSRIPATPNSSTKAIAKKLIRECIKTKNRTLSLSNLQLQNLPYELIDCKHVEEIDLSWNGLSCIPTWFCSAFRNLKTLNLRGNELFELPENFFLIGELQEVDLSCNRFEYFPRSLISMKWLDTVDLSDNCLLNIPADIDKMKNSLKNLDISGNSLMTLPIEFQKLKKLKTLCIDDNNFLQSEIATVGKIFEPMLRSKRERNEVINHIVGNHSELLGYTSTSINTYRDKYSAPEFQDEDGQPQISQEVNSEEGDEEELVEYEDPEFPCIAEEDPPIDIPPYSIQIEPLSPKLENKVDTSLILEKIQELGDPGSRDSGDAPNEEEIDVEGLLIPVPVTNLSPRCQDQKSPREKVPLAVVSGPIVTKSPRQLHISPRGRTSQNATPRNTTSRSITPRTATSRASSPRYLSPRDLKSIDVTPRESISKGTELEESTPNATPFPGNNISATTMQEDKEKEPNRLSLSNLQPVEEESVHDITTSSASDIESEEEEHNDNIDEEYKEEKVATKLRAETTHPINIQRPRVAIPAIQLNRLSTSKSSSHSYNSGSDLSSTPPTNSSPQKQSLTIHAALKKLRSGSIRNPLSARQARAKSHLLRPQTDAYSFSTESAFSNQHKKQRSASAMMKDRIGILLEILESERKYIKYLTLLSDLYYRPLVLGKDELFPKEHKENLQFNPMAKKRLMISDNALKYMFPSNLTTIITFNKKFLADLEERFASSCPDFQKKSNEEKSEAVVDKIRRAENSTEAQSLFNMKIGDIFKRSAPFFKVYVSYLYDYEKSMSIIRMQKIQSKQFEKWLKNRKKMKSSEGLDIGSLLIMPCQRTPRYEILLKNLLEHTPEDHIDHSDLTEAVELVKSCAEYQNAKIRETNNKMKVHQISKLLNMSNLVKPSRRLVREGDLFLKHSKHKQRAYLFNDLLVVREVRKNPLGLTARTSPILQYSLLDVTIAQETAQTLCVRFADDYGNPMGEIEMIFDSEQLKEDWKYDIKAVLEELENKKEYIMKTQPNDTKIMKQISRKSLGNLRASKNMNDVSEIRKSVSAEKLFNEDESQETEEKEKDKKSSSMKNFLSKLGINANNILGTAKDITESKKAKRKAAEHSNSLRLSLIRNSPLQETVKEVGIVGDKNNPSSARESSVLQKRYSDGSITSDRKKDIV